MTQSSPHMRHDDMFLPEHGVMTESSSHRRDDDMFLQEHLARRVNVLRIDPGRLMSELLHVLNV
jgi:hypothetical protein